MSKFELSKFWRQRSDCCLFWEIIEIHICNNEETRMLVVWHRKMHEGYKQIGDGPIRIRAKDYDDYSPYTPVGGKFSEN